MRKALSNHVYMCAMQCTSRVHLFYIQHFERVQQAQESLRCRNHCQPLFGVTIVVVVYFERAAKNTSCRTRQKLNEKRMVLKQTTATGS